MTRSRYKTAEIIAVVALVALILTMIFVNVRIWWNCTQDGGDLVQGAFHYVCINEDDS